MKTGDTAVEEADLLRLAVVDVDDLNVLSAHLQGAEASFGQMAYLPRSKRFALSVCRFDWTAARTGRYQRCRVGLHFEQVLKVAQRGIAADMPDRTLELLAISFVPSDPPGGVVLMIFAGGGQIRLTVECLEAEMRDLGPRWTVAAQPVHPLDDAKPIG